MWEENLPLLEGYIKKSVGKKAFDENYDFLMHEFKTGVALIASSQKEYILNEGKDPCRRVKPMALRWLCQLLMPAAKREKKRDKKFNKDLKKRAGKRPPSKQKRPPGGEKRWRVKDIPKLTPAAQALRARLAKEAAEGKISQASKRAFYRRLFGPAWEKCKANPKKCSAAILTFFGVSAGELVYAMGWRAVDDPDYVEPAPTPGEESDILDTVTTEKAGGTDSDDRLKRIPLEK